MRSRLPCLNICEVRIDIILASACWMTRSTQLEAYLFNDKVTTFSAAFVHSTQSHNNRKSVPERAVQKSENYGVVTKVEFLSSQFVYIAKVV